MNRFPLSWVAHTHLTKSLFQLLNWGYGQWETLFHNFIPTRFLCLMAASKIVPLDKTSLLHKVKKDSLWFFPQLSLPICVSLPLSLSISLIIVLSFCLSISLYLPSSLSLSHISFSLPVYLTISFFCLSLSHISFSLPVYLAIFSPSCLSLSHISFSLPVYLTNIFSSFVYLTLSLSLFACLSHHLLLLSVSVPYIILSACLSRHIFSFLSVSFPYIFLSACLSN